MLQPGEEKGGVDVEQLGNFSGLYKLGSSPLLDTGRELFVLPGPLCRGVTAVRGASEPGKLRFERGTREGSIGL